MKKELLLISTLRKDGRATLTQISKTTRIPISTLFDMLRRNDIIMKNTCIPDFSKLGYGIRAVISVKVPVDVKEEVKNYLLKTPNLNNLYKVNNGFDFICEVIYKNLHDVEQFVEKLEKDFPLEQKQVHYIIDDLAREAFFSDPKSHFLLNV